MSRRRAVLPLTAVNQAPVEPLYRSMASVVAPVLRLATKQDWRGGDNVPRTGGIIVVSNHVSYFDPIPLGHFLVWHGRWPRAMAKSEVFGWPLVGWLARSLHQIPVERNTVRAKDSLDKAAEALERGECVVIYPEGTVTHDPDTWPMTARPGVARLAFRTGAPVIPIAQWGANFVMPKGSAFPRLLPRKTMQVQAGPAVKLDDLAEAAGSPAAVGEAGVRIMDAITAQLAQLRGVAAPQERFDLRAGRRLPRDWARDAK